MLGDIIPPDNLKYRFIFESKNYTNLDTHNLLNPKGCKTVSGWINELAYDIESAIMCNQKNVIGFLLIKLKQKGNWIVGNMGNILNTIKTDGSIVFPYPYLIFEHKVKEELTIENYDNYFFLCDFNSFIEKNHQLLFEVI